MPQISKLNSGRVLVTPPSNVSSDRYNWLGLDSAEPNLGTSGNGYVLTSNISGSRIWTNNLSIANVTANTITANYFYGNATYLTGLPSSNVTKIINGTTDITAYDSSNIAVTINGTANTAVFFGSNLVLSGYYYGDGSRLTGIVTSGNLLSNTDITIQTLTNGNIYLNAGGTGIVQIVGNDALGLPAGDDTTRPIYPAVGYFRYNTDRSSIEYWDGSNWTQPSVNYITSDVINPDGASNVYALSSNATSVGLIVSINGTIQRPDYSYNVINNNQIQFTEVPLTSDTIEVRHVSAGVVQSVQSLRFGTTTSVILDAVNVNVTGNTIITGLLDVTSNITLTGDLAVNGGDITTSTTTFNLLDATATTINFAGAATTLIMGNTTGTANIRNATTNIIGNATVGGTFSIAGNIILNGSINNKPNVLIPNIATTTIDSYSTTAWRTVKYIIQAVRNSDVQSYETLVTHNGAVAAATTYGVLTLGNSLGNLSATIIGGNVQLQYTPAYSNVYMTVSRDFYPL